MSTSSAYNPTPTQSPFRERLVTAQAHWQINASQRESRLADGLLLRYAVLPVSGANGLVVIATGRAESYLKYQDIAYELNQRHYSVLLYDHRGQGFSDRILRDPQKGYVTSFDDYVDDLKHLVELEVKSAHPMPKILLSHSMGSTVGALYATRYPHDFDGMILSSPFFGLPAGLPGRWLAATLNGLEKLRQKIGSSEPGFIPGIGQYSNIPFDENTLTHSEERYAYTGELVRRYPQIALGDPTTHWVHVAYHAFDQLFANIDKIKTPFLLLQAGDERVVDNKAQDEFCTRLQHLCYSGHPVVIDGARHELLNESEQYRAQAVGMTFEFLGSIE